MKWQDDKTKLLRRAEVVKPEAISRKASVLAFLAMMSVVLIHCRTVGADYSLRGVVFFEWMFCETLTRWAVPYFFLVSGYFFMKSYERGGYVEFIRRKCHTLAIPYLLWTIVGTVFSTALILINNKIMHKIWNERTFFAQMTIWNSIDRLMGITVNGPLGALHLWYVRVLLLFFLAAPVWGFLVKKGRWLALVLAIGLVLFPLDFRIKCCGLSVASVGWILLGCCVNRFHLADKKVPVVLWAGAGVGWLFACLILSLEACGWLQWGGKEYLLGGVPFLGVVFFWGLGDRLILIVPEKLPQIFQETFWIYCMHPIVTGWMLATMFFLVGKSSVSVVLIMFVTPPVAITFSHLVAKLVRTIFPRAYSALTGGR